MEFSWHILRAWRARHGISGRVGASMVMIAACSTIPLAVAPLRAETAFSEVAAAAGIDYVHGYAGTAGHLRSYTLGAAFGDYDNDGWADLYVCNGFGFSNRLYRNNGDGTFEDRTAQTGADLELLNTESQAPLWFDYDGDGWLDLFIATDANPYDPKSEEPPSSSQSLLFRNLGNGQFEDTTIVAGIPSQPYLNVNGVAYTMAGGATAGDLNHDGFPELYISYWSGPDVLLLNNGNGTFTDVSSGVILRYDIDNFTAVMKDFNSDNWIDLFINVDFEANQLLLHQGDLTFIDEAKSAGVDSDWNEMGMAIGDYDNDLDLDFYITNLEWPPDVVGTEEPATRWNRFFRNDSAGDTPFFTDVGPELHCHRTGFGWGTTFIDYNHDRWLDLAVVNGNDGYYAVYHTDPSRFFRNNGDGTFSDVSEEVGFNDTGIARALAAADYDHDGDEDLLVTNAEAPLLLYRNDAGSSSGNWIIVDPIGLGPNHRAIGSIVYVEAEGLTQMRYLTAGNSFISQSPDEAHFGLGAASQVDSIRVVWPDGSEQELTKQPVNSRINVRQGVVAFDITGPSSVGPGGSVSFTATLHYENGSFMDVTSEAKWSLSDPEFGEFDSPGSLLVSDESIASSVTTTVLAHFEQWDGQWALQIADLTAPDVTAPLVTVVQPDGAAELAIEASSISLTGTAQDDRDLAAVFWKNDRGGSGPCAGTLNWSTGPIALAEGENVITVRATDGASNVGTAELLVNYSKPKDAYDEEPPDSDEEANEGDTEAADDGDAADGTDDTADESASASNEATPSNGQEVEATEESTGMNELPVEDESALEISETPRPRTGVCGVLGMLTWVWGLAGLWVLRRDVRLLG